MGAANSDASAGDEEIGEAGRRARAWFTGLKVEERLAVLAISDEISVKTLCDMLQMIKDRTWESGARAFDLESPLVLRGELRRRPNTASFSLLISRKQIDFVFRRTRMISNRWECFVPLLSPVELDAYVASEELLESFRLVGTDRIEFCNASLVRDPQAFFALLQRVSLGAFLCTESIPKVAQTKQLDYVEQADWLARAGWIPAGAYLASRIEMQIWHAFATRRIARVRWKDQTSQSAHAHTQEAWSWFQMLPSERQSAVLWSNGASGIALCKAWKRLQIKYVCARTEIDLRGIGAHAMHLSKFASSAYGDLAFDIADALLIAHRAPPEGHSAFRRVIEPLAAFAQANFEPREPGLFALGSLRSELLSILQTAVSTASQHRRQRQVRRQRRSAEHQNHGLGRDQNTYNLGASAHNHIASIWGTSDVDVPLFAWSNPMASHTSVDDERSFIANLLGDLDERTSDRATQTASHREEANFHFEDSHLDNSRLRHSNLWAGAVDAGVTLESDDDGQHSSRAIARHGEADKKDQLLLTMETSISASSIMVTRMKIQMTLDRQGPSLMMVLGETMGYGPRRLTLRRMLRLHHEKTYTDDAAKRQTRFMRSDSSQSAISLGSTLNDEAVADQACESCLAKDREIASYQRADAEWRRSIEAKLDHITSVLDAVLAVKSSLSQIEAPLADFYLPHQQQQQQQQQEGSHFAPGPMLDAVSSQYAMYYNTNAAGVLFTDPWFYPFPMDAVHGPMVHRRRPSTLQEQLQQEIQDQEEQQQQEQQQRQMVDPAPPPPTHLRHHHHQQAQQAQAQSAGSTQMFRTSSAGAFWQGAPPTSMEGIHRLDLEIAGFVEACQTHRKQRLSAEGVIVERVTGVVRHLWPRATVKKYGSCASGLSLPDGDLDLVICLPKVMQDDIADEPGPLEGRNAIKMSWQQNLAEALRFAEWIDGDTVKTILTPVPIIKLTTLAPARVQLDISFQTDQHNGLATVKLVATLRKQHLALTPLLLILKKFLADRGLGYGYAGGLSSYGLLLLVVVYLQNGNPALATPAPRQNGTRIRSSSHGQFSHHAYPTTVNAHLGHLLLGFLNFYGRHFDAAAMGVSLAKGIFPRKSENYFTSASSDTESLPGRTSSFHLRERLGAPTSSQTRSSVQADASSFDSHRFDPVFIDDPLSPGNNVGRNCFRIASIQRAFMDASDVLRRALFGHAGQPTASPLLQKIVRWPSSSALSPRPKTGQPAAAASAPASAAVASS
ncbi:Hypothetical Protein FCC1311_039712 [Hondaea fermentalgiana]|uniref:Uncharacterized protein n=1 Tax=Hondaea fermentalgiana TaxID=2315210 RepID=A0A2R5GDF7_9STRA|nr:Hypothetical Protein FCC1311_039712 [Hondaea fermentalgiana]|eukprot:GBG27748.1 Hypothetical Protein FCC1311_039712 [Hondaea fermentalgiana]